MSRGMKSKAPVSGEKVSPSQDESESGKMEMADYFRMMLNSRLDEREKRFTNRFDEQDKRSGSRYGRVFEYRLYYARGRISVIILGNCQALHPSTGSCCIEGLTPLDSIFFQSSEMSSLPTSFLLASRLGLLRPSPFGGLR